MKISSVSSTIDENKTTEKRCKISKFRNYSSQIYATFATNILKCTVGSSIGFTTVLVAEFHKDDSEIHLSKNDITWFSSKLFMVPISALFLGIMAQRIGSRSTMLISAVFYTISFLLFYFATSPEVILGAQALGGLFFQTAVGPGITYVVEIAQPPLRSALTASTTLSSIFAAFFVLLLSNFFHWRTIALIILVFPITGFIAVYTIPDSPYWLASKKRFSEAETALRWLRGWSPSENVASEFSTLKKFHTCSPHNLDHSNENNTTTKESSFKSKIKFYLHKSFYVPLLSISLLFSLHNCMGQYQLSAYSIVIFGQINAPIDPHMTATIFDAMRILGAIVCILSIHYTGKKKLTYITIAGAALTHFTSSTALILKDYQIYPETCQWVATIAIMFTTFITSAGIDKVIYILNAEIFPTKFRNVGAAIGLFVNAVVHATGNKIFLSLLDAVTLQGVFIIFGFGCIVTGIVFHFTFIETEGKALYEIENHYNGVKQQRIHVCSCQEKTKKSKKFYNSFKHL